MFVIGAAAPIGVEGAEGIFAFEAGVGIGEAGSEGGGGFRVADSGVVFLGFLDFLTVACGEVGGILFHFLFGKPAGGGEVGGAGGFGHAEPLALLFVGVFGDRPLGLEGAGGAAVFLNGAEKFAIGAGGDFGDGFLDAGVLVGGLGADGDGAGQGVSGNLAAIGDGAGFGGVEGAGKEAVDDLGEDELDGGGVVEEGHGDFGALFRADGIAVVLMGMAVVLAEEGGGVALETIDAERAAAAGGFGQVGIFGCGRAGAGFGVRHETSLVKSVRVMWREERAKKKPRWRRGFFEAELSLFTW
jgi:hypothetical protein